MMVEVTPMPSEKKSRPSKSKALARVPPPASAYSVPKEPREPKYVPPQKEYRMCWLLAGGDPARLPEIEARRAEEDAEEAAKRAKVRKLKPVASLPALPPPSIAPAPEEPAPEGPEEKAPDSQVRTLALVPVPASTPKSRYMAFVRGFGQGASGRKKADSDREYEHYLRGYSEGVAARDAAGDAYADIVGYRPSILKVQDL